MASDRKADPKLAEKIRSVLQKGGQYTALQIARTVGLEKASDVNSVLYALFKSGRLSKTDSQPPLWSLGKPEETTSPASLKAAKSNDKKTVHEEDIVSVLETSENREGLTASQIASKLGESRTSVNSILYDMSRNGVVKKSEKKWSLVNGENNQSAKSDNQNETKKIADSWFSRNFDVIQALGSGGYGSVVKVKHKVDDKIFAVKTVKFTIEADREVKALANLDHPNIVRYYTCWTESVHWKDDDSRLHLDVEKELSGFPEMEISEPPETDTAASTWMEESWTSSAKMSQAAESKRQDVVLNKDNHYLCIQMEFCEEGTLSTWLEKRNSGTTVPQQREALTIFQQIVTGVEYIHSKGLIHRDLKPDNILFGKDSRVKIGDFGLVTTVTSQTGGPVERTEGRGTPSYRSPEQEKGSSYDEKTDIFPLGLICVELLWKMTTISEMIKVRKDLRNQVFPEDFSKEHSSELEFIKKMLAEDPSERQSAKEILEFIEKFFLRDRSQLRERTL